MKKPQEIKESRSKLNTSEQADISWLHTELATFLDTDEVSLNGIVTLENMINTLNNFRRGYTQRVIRLMKQAHIVD
jgi:hypothetical protein|tara:strand:- start:129 stop:356 length:228 start_codon:yes stop_codon:yes gene_type:complete